MLSLPVFLVTTPIVNVDHAPDEWKRDVAHLWPRFELAFAALRVVTSCLLCGGLCVIVSSRLATDTMFEETFLKPSVLAIATIAAVWTIMHPFCFLQQWLVARRFDEDTFFYQAVGGVDAEAL